MSQVCVLCAMMLKLPAQIVHCFAYLQVRLLSAATCQPHVAQKDLESMRRDCRYDYVWMPTLIPANWV